MSPIFCIISNIFPSHITQKQTNRLFKLPFQSSLPFWLLSSAVEWKILNQDVWVKNAFDVEKCEFVPVHHQ